VLLERVLVPGSRFIVYEDAAHRLFLTHADRLNADLVDLDSRQLLPKTDISLRSMAHISRVVETFNGQWKLAAFQNTTRRSMGPGIGSVLVWTITDWLWTLLRRKSEMRVTREP
jgi:hypothetical protein